VRKQSRVAGAHARQAHGQVFAQTVDRAQGDRHRTARTAAASNARPVVPERRRFSEQKTEEQKAMMVTDDYGYVRKRSKNQT